LLAGVEAEPDSDWISDAPLPASGPALAGPPSIRPSPARKGINYMR
jgi:hypothetical protein